MSTADGNPLTGTTGDPTVAALIGALHHPADTHDHHPTEHPDPDACPTPGTLCAACNATACTSRATPWGGVPH